MATARETDSGPRSATTRGRRTARIHAVAVAVLLAAGGRPARAGPPRLIVEAPAELSAAASAVRSVAPERFLTALRLTGLDDPGPPITVVLAPESSPAARSAPPWISGWAFGERGVVVLLPGRVQHYPDDDLASLLQHEVTHVLIARAARGQPVPRWLDEGLAMAASRGRDLEDRGRVAWSVLVHGPGSLERLEEAFAGGEVEMQAAYAFSQDFVQDLLRRQGEAAMPDLLARLAQGTEFPAAFREAMHLDLSVAEADYWSRRTFWMRWVPVLTSSTLLWIGISALAVVAIHRRRARDAERRRRWDEEERGFAPDPQPPADENENGSETETVH